MLRDLRTLRPYFGVVLAALLFTRAPLAAAQTDEQRAGARALATDGATAFNEGRWKDAVDLFSRAESLVHAPPHLLFLARAQEKLGKLVQARENYLKIVKETLPANAPQAFHGARAAAEQELRAVEPRIATLTIQVQAPASAADLRVVVDGVVIPAALVGVARPVDPGEHRIEVAATGYRARPETVKLGEGERRSVSLALIAEPSAAPVTPAPSGSTMTPEAPPVAPTPGRELATEGPNERSTDSGTSGLRIGSYAAWGVGAVGLGLGTYFLFDSRGKRSDADAAYEDCDARNDCRENDSAARRTTELDDDARKALTFSIVGFSVGAVGVAVGTALFLVSSNETRERAHAGLTIRPYVGLDRAGLYGSF